MFKHAIHDVNANRNILSRSNLSGQVEKVSPQDSFHASKRGNLPLADNLISYTPIDMTTKRICSITPLFIQFFAVCSLLRLGVAAVFGPQSAQISSHVQSICDTMEIPHLETRWDYKLRRESCLVNLYPHPTVLSKVTLIYIIIYRIIVISYYRIMYIYMYNILIYIYGSSSYYL